MTYARFFLLSIAVMLGINIYAWAIGELTPFAIAVTSSTMAITCLGWFAGTHRAEG